MLSNSFTNFSKQLIASDKLWAGKCLLLLIALLSMNATCERPIDLDLDLPAPGLVVISNFTLGEPVKVSVSKSQNILDESPEEYLANARVTLYEGDQFLEELTLVIDQVADRIKPYYITTQFRPEHSTTYTIKVDADGFDSVSAMSFIPLPVAIDHFEVSGLQVRSGVQPFTNQYTYNVFLNFMDPTEEGNYYHLSFSQEVFLYTNTEGGDTIKGIREIYPASFTNLDNTNYVEAYIGGGVLLKENPFSTNGLDFTLNITINPEFQLLGKVYAELRTVSAEYYNFHASVTRQQDQNEGPFETQITIFNNVMNGHGVFAGYNAHVDSTSLDI